MNWYVVRVQPRKEFSARALLERRGFSVLLPMEHKWRSKSRYSKKKTLHSYALLVGYLFIGTNGKLPWHELRALPFLQGFIAVGDEPYRLPAKELEYLVSLSTVIIPHTDTQNPHKAIRPGDDALIVNGPFVGKVVKVGAITGQKAKAAIELFGSMQMVELKLSSLEAA